MATRVTHKAIQIHGANGYSREYPVERNYRAVRIVRNPVYSRSGGVTLAIQES